MTYLYWGRILGKILKQFPFIKWIITSESKTIWTCCDIIHLVLFRRVDQLNVPLKSVLCWIKIVLWHYSLLKLFSRLLAYKDLCYIHTPLQQRLVGIVKKFLSACRKSGSSCLDDRSLTGMKLRNIVVGKERELYWHRQSLLSRKSGQVGLWNSWNIVY